MKNKERTKPEMAERVGLLTAEEAIDKLGVSPDHFRNNISPALKGVTLNRVKFFQMWELELWLRRYMREMRKKAQSYNS